jgi:hypothetical protein
VHRFKSAHRPSGGRVGERQVIRTDLHAFQFWQVAVHCFQSDESATNQVDRGILGILSNCPLEHGPGSVDPTALWLQEQKQYFPARTDRRFGVATVLSPTEIFWIAE